MVDFLYFDRFPENNTSYSVDHFVFPSVEEGLVKHVEADAIEFEVFGACNLLSATLLKGS